MPPIKEGILSYIVDKENNVCLFTNIFNTIELLRFFNPLESVTASEIRLDKGKGETYQHYNLKNLPPFQTIGELFQIIDKIGLEELEIFSVKMDIGVKFHLYIHEGSSWLYFKSMEEEVARGLIYELLNKVEKFQQDSELIYQVKNKEQKDEEYKHVLFDYLTTLGKRFEEGRIQSITEFLYKNPNRIISIDRVGNILNVYQNMEYYRKGIPMSGK